MRAGAFVDSGAFIAFLDRSDRHHEAVHDLFARPPRNLYTSVPIVSQTYGWFLHRMGEEAARTFLALLRELPGLRLLCPDEAHHAAVMRKLEELRGHKLTYVDASSLVWMGRRGIGLVWGTDHHLCIEGGRVVPGSSPP